MFHGNPHVRENFVLQNLNRGAITEHRLVRPIITMYLLLL